MAKAEPTTPTLCVRGLSKRFPGAVALRGVSLEVYPGETHALVGENGAGKSTLVKVVAGILAPDEGEVVLSGQVVTRFSPAAARQRGVALVAQEPEHFSDLTALENLFVGHWPRSRAGLVRWRDMERQARQLLTRMGVSVDLSARMGDLSLADRQAIQIGRALLLDAKLLILDEPTAALGSAETKALFGLVRRLAEQGVAVIYISHRLEEIYELADRVTVLRDGGLVATQPVASVPRDDLVRLMVGSAVPGVPGAPPQPASLRDAPPVLELRGAGCPGRFQDVSLELRRGEILGLAGLAGSGRNELAHALGGALPITLGEVLVDGVTRKLSSPRAARRAGIVLAPGDRPGRALVLPFPLRANVTLSVLHKVSRGPVISRARESALAGEYVGRLDIRASSVEQTTATLSGGNQQKVSLARRLATEPRVLVLEEPTQGVDVGARAEIHALLRSLSNAGHAILLVNSDLDELLSLSHRVAVMHRGRVAGVLSGTDATKERVLSLAFGEGSERMTEPVRPRRRVRAVAREAGLAVFLAALCCLLATRSDQFLTAGNLRDMAENNASLLVAALGMMLIILTAGIDISVGSILALCCVAAGLLATGGAPVWLAVLGALAVGLTLGAANGLGVALLRLPPIIVTLATLTIYRGLVMQVTGGSWITGIPEGFRRLGSDVLGVPIPVVVALLAALACSAALRWTGYGRSLYAIGNNASAAEHVGISLAWMRWSVFALGGALVGVSALTHAPLLGSIQTNTGTGFEMVAITAVVVGGTNIFGGRGTVLGTLLGVMLLAVINNGLNLTKASDYWEQLFQGALVLTAVTADYLWTRARRGWAGEP